MSRFYDTTEWQRARRQALHDAGHVCSNDKCRRSLVGIGKQAHVHHRKELKRAPALRSEPLNLKPLCVACHNAEHAREKKFGNRVNVDGSPGDPRHPWYGGDPKTENR